MMIIPTKTLRHFWNLRLGLLHCSHPSRSHRANGDLRLPSFPLFEDKDGLGVQERTVITHMIPLQYLTRAQVRFPLS